VLLLRNSLSSLVAVVLLTSSLSFCVDVLLLRCTLSSFAAVEELFVFLYCCVLFRSSLSSCVAFCYGGAL
jgi:hypothetical protein